MGISITDPKFLSYAVEARKAPPPEVPNLRARYDTVKQEFDMLGEKLARAEAALNTPLIDALKLALATNYDQRKAVVDRLNALGVVVTDPLI